jgi:hypothetical protein
MEKIIIKSKPNLFNRSISLITFILFGVVSYSLLKPALEQKYIDLSLVCICLPFIVCSLLSFVSFWTYFEPIRIFLDRIEIKKAFGLYKKVFFFDEISKIETRNGRSKYISWEELIICGYNNRKYKIYSSSYQNYDDIKNNLGRHKIRPIYKNNKTDDTKVEKVGWGLFFTFFGLLLYGIYNAYSYDLDRNKLVEVELTLENKPKVYSAQKRNYLVLPIQEYAGLKFEVDYIKATMEHFVNTTNANEKIYLTLDKEEYAQKLKQNKSLSFANKHLGYANIAIFALRTDNETVIRLEDEIATLRASKRETAYLFVFIILILLFTVRNEIIARI